MLRLWKRKSIRDGLMKCDEIRFNDCLWRDIDDEKKRKRSREEKVQARLGTTQEHRPHASHTWAHMGILPVGLFLVMERKFEHILTILCLRDDSTIRPARNHTGKEHGN